MKRRFFVLILFAFMSLLFMGCDFLGGNTTITTTTTTTTTTETTVDPTTTLDPATTTTTTTTEAQSTTTTEPQTTTTTTEGQTTTTTEPQTTTTTAQQTTTTTAQQTTTTTAQQTTTTTAQQTTTTTAQQTTTTTAQQTTTTTAQQTTTTTGQQTTTTTADQTTTTGVTTIPDTTTITLTTTVVGEIDVTFLDWDGTVIDVVTVAYGGDATPPANPTRPGNGFYTYTFTGWDAPYTNVTASITVQAQYSVNYNSPTAYSHENLLNLVSNFTGTTEPVELEAEVVMMMEMTGAVSEHELFDMMNGMMELMQDLQNARTAQDLQDLFAKSVVLGFNADMIARLGFNLLHQGLIEERQSTLDEIEYLEQEIINLEAEIIQVEAAKDNILQTARDYCATTDYDSLCQTYINNIIAEMLADTAYYDALYSNYYGEEFDWDAYSELEFYYAEYVYARDVDMDPIAAAEYQGYYMSYYNSFNPEHQAEIDDLLVLYDAYQVAQNNRYNTDYSALDNDDTNGERIREKLDQIIFGYWDNVNEEYIDGYVDLFWETNHLEWFIVEMTWNIEWLRDSIVSLEDVIAYLEDPVNAANVQKLIRIVYDGLFATTAVIDQEMVDFINMLIQPGSYTMMMGKEGLPLEHFLNPENITYVVNKLGAILGAFEATLSEEDYVVMGDVFKSLFPLLVFDPDMTELEKEALANEIAMLYDLYFPIIRTTTSDLIGFFNAFTEAKAEKILGLVFMIGNDPTSMDYLLYQVASTYEVVLGDDSFDIKALILNTVDIYYLVTQELNPDPLEVAATKVVVGNNVDQILLLATEIAGFNPSGFTPENLAVIDEFMARIENLVMCYSWGFEIAESDFTDLYQSSDFDNLLYNLGYMDVEQAKTDIMLMLGETDEETAYYMFRALMNYTTYLMNVKSFADLQSWVGNIDTFGFTQEEVLDIMLAMIEKELAAQADGDDWYQQQVQAYQDQIDYYNQQMDYYLQQLDDIDVIVIDYIAGLDSGLQDDATAYWEAYKLNRDNDYVYYAANWHVEMLIGYSNLWELEDAYYELYMAINADPFDQTEVDAAQAVFDGIYNMFDPEIQAELDIYLEIYEHKFAHYQEVFYPLEQALYANTMAYGDFLGLIEGQGSNYSYLLGQYYSSQQYRDEYLSYLQDMMGQNTEVLMILDLIQNNRTLVLSVLNILFDDIQYMFANTSETAFEEVYDLIKFVSMKHGYFEEFTTSDILALLQDFSNFMQLRGTTIDETEEGIIEDLIEVIVIAIADNEGMEGPEKDAFVALLTPIALKYLGFGDAALTEITDLIDTLTLEDIDMLVDTVHSFYYPMGDFDRVIMIAELVDGIFNTPEFDLQLIFGMGLEVYFDLEYMFDYQEADLLAVQTAFGIFTGETMSLISDIAEINKNDITTEEIAMILELQDRVEYLGMIMNNPEAILDGYTYAYSHDDFLDLVMMIFPELNTTEAEARIVFISNTFDMTEEESYYLFTAILSTLRNIGQIQSVGDIAGIYQSLHSIGLTNADIASYGMAMFMELLYPQIQSQYDTTYIQSEIDYYEGELLNIQDDLDDIDNTVYDELDLLTDPILTDAINLWEMMKTYQRSVADFNQWSESGEYYYNYDLYYNQLQFAFQMAYDNGDWSKVDQIIDEYGMDYEEYFYFQMFFEKGRAIDSNEDILDMMISDFETNYPGQMIANGQMTLLSLMTSMESNYYGYYNNYSWTMIMLDQYYYELVMMEENAIFLETIYEFLAVQANVDATESMLLILLDEVDALTQSPDLQAFDFLAQFMFDHTKLADYTPAELSAEIIRVSNFFGLIFNSIDPTEIVAIEAYINSLADVYVDNLGFADPQDAIDLKLAIAGLVSTYVEDLLAVPDILSVFLASFDATKTDDLLRILEQFHNINHYDDLSSLQAAVIFSQVIVLLDDDSLDYETLIATVYGLMYDVALTTGYPGELTTTEVLDNITLTIDAILLQAVIVGDLGFDDVTMADAPTVQALIDLFEDLMMHFALE